MTFAQKINRIVRRLAKSSADEQELFARAWLQATGLSPQESIMCEQTLPTDSGLVRKVWFERKGDR